MSAILFTFLLFLQSGAAPQSPAATPLESLQKYPVGGSVVSGRVRSTHGKFQPGFVRTVTLTPEPKSSLLRPAPSLGDPAAALEASVGPDGTFEFRSIPPGTYTLRTLPIAPGTTGLSLDVARKNIREIEVVVPFQVEISGRVLNLGRIFGTHPVVQADQGSFTMATTVLDDGTFKLKLTEGENRISISRLPPSFLVKSITFGEEDVMQSSLNVDFNTPNHTLTVTLDNVESDPLPAVSAKTGAAR
jgi:hypothetical protein